MKHFLTFCLAFMLITQYKAQTVVDIIVSSPVHTTLETAVGLAGLADDLSGEGPFTVFAPTDAAFGNLPAGLLDALIADPTGDLAQVLLYHVVGANALSTSLADGQVITTLLGQTVTVDINGGVFINDAQVTVADIIADNGVVHVIDAVLVPQLFPNTVVDIIVASPDHTILETAVGLAELADDLSGEGPFTVFAPTDAAFGNLPAGLLDALIADPTGDLAQVLLYHVVGANALSTSLADGQVITTLLGQTVTVDINGGVFINDAQVTVADIIADNGVVHVIDAVLVPQLFPNTVVDIIVASPDHTILETAVGLAELADDLSGEGPFTVFAPTDAAFGNLPAGLLDALIADPTGDLAQVLLYHVVGANALSTSLADGQVITTLLGQTVTVDINGGVFINDAQVTVADIIADNGVVHVIDAVLVPQLFPNTVVDIIVASPDHTILETAVGLAELADDLSTDGPFTVFAPTDAAFGNLPAGLLDALIADPTGDLAQVLLYHVVGANALSTSLADGQVITTLLGQTVTVDINGGVFINDAQVTVADIIADNGVVHVIDAVLVPQLFPNTVVDIIVASPDHTILETAVGLAELADDLSGEGPFTVFAPTDAAFGNLPAGLLDALIADPTGDLAQVLLYHVVGANALSTSLADGQVITTLLGQTVTVDINGGVFINDAQVTVADIIADNGVVHVIDAVLVPQLFPNTVVDIIVASPDHTILETAVGLAELADDLSTDGPFTVFAPTDAAFGNLPAGLLDALIADPTGDLAQLLLYHVVPANALSTSLTDGQVITTLQGQEVTVNLAGGVFINGAEVIVADLIADNGVVHVINAVLTPESSVNEKEEFTTVIYPNPVNDILNLSFSVSNEMANYEIFNAMGELVKVGYFSQQNNVLNVEELSAGLYNVRLILDNQYSVKSFIKN